GNRDFLFADGFRARTGCELLPDEHVIELYGQRVLLMHGDTLCTDDVAYLQLRQLLRDPQWQTDFLQKPFAARLQLALNLRTESQQQTAQKSAAIMDVSLKTVLARMHAHNVMTLIHGHTHRMYHHYLTDQAKTLQRIVLSDWHGEAHALEVYSNGEQHLY
ncbi:MAG TPA: UDP-2,3-diacylglucosamine diphosphatase, partial [Thiothrix sp.]|nr:UDP-2,3-diacylglucosamine diphosphatase [Thiothrix sp.]